MLEAATRYGNRGGTRSGSRLYAALPIAGLAIWLDAQDLGSITQSSTLVSQWNNKGMASVGHAVQATDARKPKYIAAAINGKPALQGRHDGTNASNLTIADHAGLNYTACTIFTVFSRVTDLAATAEFLGGKYVVAGNQREIRQYITTSDFHAASASADGTAATTVTLASNATLVNTPAVIETHYDGATLTVRKNGVTTNTASLASVFNGTGGYMLFSRDSFGDPYAGYIGEHLFYTRALNTVERAQVLTYLTAKWGV